MRLKTVNQTNKVSDTLMNDGFLCLSGLDGIVSWPLHGCLVADYRRVTPTCSNHWFMAGQSCTCQ